MPRTANLEPMKNGRSIRRVSRREFVATTATAGASPYLSGCDVGSKPAVQGDKKTFTIPHINHVNSNPIGRSPASDC
jgi:hypothetical protein